MNCNLNESSCIDARRVQYVKISQRYKTFESPGQYVEDSLTR